MIDLRGAGVDPKNAGFIRDLAAPEASVPKATKEGVNIIRSRDAARRLYESASTPREKELKKVADSFVSLLYNLLFKQMDQTVERTGLLDGGPMEETFRPFLLEKYAESAASQKNFDLNYRMYEYLYESNARRDVPLPRLDTFG
ncbi:MAG: hypothetical protein D6679_12120 [Candidatus Hydrogenedentota bacterium]|nr:MAG: hypothetical protein D6679_12120 [Candidatus Hydrogenedentota bacterium]